ncbi:hypothetical protein GCM10017673_50320 [Streptosporangium violaceochromogenes]|nr:hypothetical protein GCM10017673_50320 [Streptosporangium violaceochromogenes]
MRLTPEERRTRLSACKVGIFHLELRDSYAVGGERSAFTRWLAGQPETEAEIAARRNGWGALVGSITGRGGTVRRVRVITEPVSDYIRWEHEGTALNLEFGEDVRWLPRHRLPAGAVFPVGGNDFWLVDDDRVIVGYFDADGRPSGRELITDPDAVADCVRVRDLLWGMAVPHAGYPLPPA